MIITELILNTLQFHAYINKENKYLRNRSKFCICEEGGFYLTKQSLHQASKILSLLGSVLCDRLSRAQREGSNPHNKQPKFCHCEGAFCVIACPERSEREAIPTTNLQSSVIARERSVRPQQSPAWANKRPVRVGWVERSHRNPTSLLPLARRERARTCRRDR
jgi:hypothetical protein